LKLTLFIDAIRFSKAFVILFKLNKIINWEHSCFAKWQRPRNEQNYHFLLGLPLPSGFRPERRPELRPESTSGARPLRRLTGKGPF
jgi:hypothetical protein